ncbi:MAG: amidohydrolase family protein [Treponemataceae bacterium]
MKIIDGHMHLGEDLMFLTDDSEEILLKTMDANGVDALILQPGIVAKDQKRAHERIHAFAVKNPGRVHGLTCFSPFIDEAEYLRLVRWTVKELGFVGVKLHPYAYCVSPSHPLAEKIFKVAAELDITVMIHTGNGVPNALPSLCLPVAKKYKDLRIVLAHAGGGMYGAEATIVAQECPNVFLETSWMPVYELENAIKKIGCERVMMGSDLITNLPGELAKYRALGLTDKQLEWCFEKTARKAYKLN